MEDKKYQEAFHDPEVTKYNSHGLFPYTKTRREEFAKELENSTSRIVWAIVENAEYKLFDEPKTLEAHFTVDDSTSKPTPIPANVTYTQEILIGNCTLQRIDYINRSAEFAIVIWYKDYWGKGAATFALSSLLKHAFLKLGLHRVWSGTALNNIGMQKVMEKCGMRLEGVWKDGAFLNGVFTDMPYYSILEYEYKEEK